MKLDAKIARIRRQLLADRKKFGALMGLFVVGLLLWGRLLIHNVPRTATAVTPIASAAPMPDNPAPHSPRSTERDARDVRLVDSVSRDLFAVNPALFPKIDAGENPTGVAKSVMHSADDLEQQHRVIEAEARALKLQSTILGAQPRAMINGKLIAPGQTIQGFEVLEIRPRSVLVNRHGVKIELEM